ncbi:MAG: restriction endonuclease subunit R [Candidatus Parcubacteria bacterium]|nr:MAG: restriction endonuclease subunit R [Candidatus Parcubacteria bacterium]
MIKITEQKITKQALIEWFKELGYSYLFGPDIAPDGIYPERKSYKEVVLVERLENAIRRLNPKLNDEAIKEAIDEFLKFEHPNLEMANKGVYKMIVEGISIEVKKENGERRGEIVKVIDFDDYLNNDFLIVDEFAVQGPEKVRRPDVVVFINGIPVAIFELKNPTIEEATIQTAYEQLEEYKKDIPEIFKYNQILVISDLTEAKYGTISSSWEWFKKWRTINDTNEKLEGVSELEVLIKGIFQRTRILDIIENFIVFEADADEEVSKYTKKICLYHQYFGVNKAIERTLKALKPNGDGRIGILWHTQGSGKTLSMVFYVNKAKKLKELNSPTFVFLTDRNDLDDQFFKTFKRCGYNALAKQAKTINDLKEKLKTAGGELIFSTVQKFTEDFVNINEKNNIIIIADEAHRSHYRELASYYRQALPNASFMGITATPISSDDRDTRLVFGDYIDIYPMSKAVEDEATVPIYYEGRLVDLHLTNYFIEDEYDELTEEVPYEVKESIKRKIRQLEEIILSKEDRLQKIAEDIIYHFNNRGLEGKAMVVTISRRVAVKMYKLLSQFENAPEVAIVISSPEDFKDEIGVIPSKKEIERRFKNPSDPLKIVVVCDMWLTGFDVPCLHTMYFDKPLKNHGLVQAIARVNRIFKDKPAGLIVDYIGIADDLRKALSIYDPEIRKDIMISIDEIIAKMQEKYDIVKAMFNGIDYENWKYLEGKELAELLEKAVNNIISDPNNGRLDEERKNRFLKESLALIKLHAFVMPHKEAYEIKDDIEFFRAVRANIIKRMTPSLGAGFDDDKLMTVVKELISKSIEVKGIIDIFSLQGKERPDISIFDEKFLEDLKNMKFKNIAIEVLRKLLQDELKIRIKRNPVRYKPLWKILEELIEKYENRLINSAKIIEKLIDLAKEIKRKENEGENLGLTEDELAFYDLLAQDKKAVGKIPEIKNFVRELVREIRRDLAIDWTNNDVIKARIMANVKRLLLTRTQLQTSEIEKLSNNIFEQAKIIYRDFENSNLLRNL